MGPRSLLLLCLWALLGAGYPVHASPDPGCPGSRGGGPALRVISSIPQEQYSATGATRVLAGHVAHGMQDMEVLMVQMGAGESTPIISHPQEKVLITLKGSGTLTVLNGSSTTSHVLGDNSTATVRPGMVHQILSDASGALELLIALADPPAKIVEYETWEEASEVTRQAEGEGGDARAKVAPWNKCPEPQNVDEKIERERERTAKDEL